MRTIVPSYYHQFRCIAGACRHSCCIGWEIDVDEDSLAAYRTMDGDIGRMLREGIEETEDGAHFRLAEDERCPMLRPDGLCELICQKGEGALCQICADHPRFRFEYADRTEMGLGLCCEAAAALVLSQTDKPELTVLDDDGDDDIADPDEEAMLDLRDELTDMLFDDATPTGQRIAALLDRMDAEMDETPMPVWAERLASLERLDEAWTAELALLRQPAQALDREIWSMPFLQLAAYFLYRHLPGALDDGAYQERVLFALVSCRILQHMLAAKENPARDDLAELARMYSAEIEYSDENLSAMLDWLTA